MHGRGFSSRRLMAAAFVGGLGLLLALVLAMPGARSPLREPFVPKATRGEAVTIPLEVRESRKRTSVYRLALSVVDASVLLDHEELQLLFSSVPTRQELVRAELRARSRACLLEAAPGRRPRRRPAGRVSHERARAPSSGRPGGAGPDPRARGRRDARAPRLRAARRARHPGRSRSRRSRGDGPAFDVRGAFVDYTPAGASHRVAQPYVAARVGTRSGSGSRSPPESPSRSPAA